MKPSIQTLGQILYSPSQYVIPVFQRNYRWAQSEWAKLWESLSEIQNPDKRGNHFMGFLVFVPGLAQPGQHTTFHLIDGQQRLTTSSILLTAVRNIARQEGQHELAEEIHQYYLVHPLKKGDQHYRLLPKERDHDSYLALVAGTGDPSGRMAAALEFFELQLEYLIRENPDCLRNMFDTLCQRLEFMCATLEAENAYNIFKSLNSTGVPLGPSDLIRNFVFMHIPPDTHDEFDEELWSPLEKRFTNADGTLDEEKFSKFFRDYLMASGRYVSPRDTFSSFEARFEATDFLPKELARELIKSSHHYSIISGEAPDESDEVTKALQELNLLESSTTYPLLLALFEKRARNVIDSIQLEQAIQMLRGFILRRFIVGDSSRGYGQIFVRSVPKDASDPIKALEDYLLDRGWPDEKRFEDAFVEFPLYERGYTREILETLERERGHKELADFGSAEIEHILPQTLSESWFDALGPDAESMHANWLHKPGNLTLSAYNKELFNHPFHIKREQYAKSNIVITRELASYERWGEAEIQERGRLLAKNASKIWIGPKEPFVRIASDKPTPERFELRRQFWSGLAEYITKENPDIPIPGPRSDWTVRLPSGVKHIGIDLVFTIRHCYVGIDVWFWREASLPVWERIRNNPEPYNELVNTEWEFRKIEDHKPACMSIKRGALEIRDEASWPHLYPWFGDVLTIIYKKVLPMLQREMQGK